MLVFLFPGEENFNLVLFRGFAQRKKQSKNPSLLWKWVCPGFTLNFVCGKSSQNCSKPVLIFWSSIQCVFCLYTLLEVVNYYEDLSVLSMSVMGFPKKCLDGGWVGGVSSIQVYF